MTNSAQHPTQEPSSSPHRPADTAEPVPADHAASPATEATPRYHMRTVNGGTPQRIETRAALREINNAMMEPTKKSVREMSAKGSNARIAYKGVRGTVLLRPATPDEAAMLVKPEAERYAPGDRVIVRPVFYRDGEHHVLPEYEGTVVNWSAGHFNVRSAEPDEHGYGVRQCSVHELRPLPPTVDDVIDAPHTLHVSGELHHEAIAADHIRRIVSNLRFQKKVFTQDPADGSILVENRRYTPQRAQQAQVSTQN